MQTPIFDLLYIALMIAWGASLLVHGDVPAMVNARPLQRLKYVWLDVCAGIAALAMCLYVMWTV